MAEKLEGKFKGPAKAMTKAELEAENDELRQRLLSLEAQAQLMEDVQPGTAGWIVETDNPEYNGRTMGVVFIGGRGFVPTSHPHASFILKEMENEFHYRVNAVNAEQVEKMRARNAELGAQSDAEAMVHIGHPLASGENVGASQV